MTHATSGPRPSDRWIPWYIVIFFVALVAVLVPMCIISVRTFTGEVADHPYEEGLKYNAILSADDKQQALGWKGDLSVAPAAQPGDIKADFVLRDRDGKPLSFSAAKVWLIRPTQSGSDQSADLKPTGDGRYSAEVKLPMRGQWDVSVAVVANGHNYQMTKRVVIP